MKYRNIYQIQYATQYGIAFNDEAVLSFIDACRKAKCHPCFISYTKYPGHHIYYNKDEPEILYAEALTNLQKHFIDQNG